MFFYRWKEHVSVNMITNYYFSICWRNNSYAVPSSLLAKTQNASYVFLQYGKMQEGINVRERNTFFWTNNNHWNFTQDNKKMMMIIWKICLLFPRLNGVLPTSCSSVAPSSSPMIYDCNFLFFTLLLGGFFYHCR